MRLIRAVLKTALRWLPAVLLALCGQAFAQSPPGLGPYLQFETGQHIQTVNALALLPGNRLVSVSDDHTARIWSQDHLAAQTVLRPPIGPYDEGELYAVAAAAGLIAVGGVIPDGGGAFSVHVYALAPKLHWIGRFASLPPTRVLRFSPDGRYLAIGLMGGAGLLVYDMAPVLRGLKEAPAPVLADLPEGSVVMSLHTSADAAAIAAVRIDSGYRGDVTGLDFDAADRLVVAAGGQIRLYGRIAPEPPRLAFGGFAVRSVAFSPDGMRIAASDLNDDAVRLLDARSLRVIQSLRGVARGRGVFIDAAFSPDGRTVFAAGTYKDAAGRYLIRHWALDGAAAGDWAAARNSILALLPVDGGLVFGSADPAVGRFNLDGQLAALQRSPLIDFRNAGLTSFRISADAATIEMPGPSAPGIIRFDLRQRELTEEGFGSSAGMLAALDHGPGLIVTGWRNSHTPRLNGLVIPLDPKETARSVSVSPSGNGVALGTDFYLRFETATGEAWRIPTPAAVWAVNMSADGRLIVAALADGSVRWYDSVAHPTAGPTADGSQFQQERLGLLVDPSTQEGRAPRWVLWTPLGFFDHDRRADGAPDGRELIGYLINLKNWHRARFVQIGQMYQTFFRPDLVDLAFRGRVIGLTAIPGQKAVQPDLNRIMAAPPPPTITLTDICGHDPQSQATGCPTNGTPGDQRIGNDLTTKADAVTLVYKIQGASGQLGSVILKRDSAVIRPDIFVDDQDAKSRTEEATVLLGTGVNEIELTPVNAAGTVQGNGAQSLLLHVTHMANAAGTKDLEPGARLYMLGIGISKYDQSQLDLANAAHDAQAMAALMSVPAPPIYVQPVVTTLLDGQATTKNIVAALKKIADQAQPDDLVVIFMAGHGQQVNGEYYFAPADFGTHDPALFNRAMTLGNETAEHAVDTLFATDGLGQDKLLPLIESVKASHLALILDTCYSAAIATQDAVLTRDMNETVASHIGDSIGRFVLSSSFNLALDTGSAGLSGVPVDEEGHGLFTGYVLLGLKGKADFMHRGQVDIDDLAKYTQQSVEAATSDMSQPQQPAYYFSGNDFFGLRTAP
jgi:WD40 repeat protein